jgi:hypothetical protein
MVINPNMEDQIMKTRIYLLSIAMLFLSGTAFAKSDFTLTNLEGSPFYVIMNGEIYDQNSSVLRLYDMHPGTIALDVYRTIRNARGHATKYVELVYRGTLYIENRIHMTTHLTADGRLVIIGRVPLKPAKGNHGGNRGTNSHGASGNQQLTASSGSGSGYQRPLWMPPISVHTEFNGLLKSVRESSFEQTRLLVAKEGVSSRLITADQVYKMMLLFSFEATRLEFAKWAYLRTSDRHNYHLVSRAFSFDASRQELTRYISMQG